MMKQSILIGCLSGLNFAILTAKMDRSGEINLIKHFCPKGLADNFGSKFTRVT